MSDGELYDVCGWCRAGKHERCSARTFPKCGSARCACAHGAEAEELARLLPWLPDAILSVQNEDDDEEHYRHRRNVARACELFLAERVRVAAKIVRLEKALSDMTADRDRLKRREQDIIEACERVADGGQYRADIVSAIDRIREERNAACARVAELEARLARDAEEPGK